MVLPSVGWFFPHQLIKTVLQRHVHRPALCRESFTKFPRVILGCAKLTVNYCTDTACCTGNCRGSTQRLLQCYKMPLFQILALPYRASQKENIFSSPAVVCSESVTSRPDFSQVDTFLLCYCIEYSNASSKQRSRGLGWLYCSLIDWWVVLFMFNK